MKSFIMIELTRPFMIERSFLDLIEKTSSDIFIPISVGGGLKNLKDIEKVLSAGADKVFINSAAIKKPKFLVEASKKFGSANICLSIEVVKNSNDEFICLSYGREVSNKKLSDWFYEAQELGVGEIILISDFMMVWEMVLIKKF